jgi:NTP pyrophosphatase (non-canonical NTP hydrolase)
LTYPALGLAGEAGEVAEHAKKAIRDDGGVVTEERRRAMAKELGDVLWYVSQLASEVGLELEEIARANLEKLLSRQRRGVLSGSGDDR